MRYPAIVALSIAAIALGGCAKPATHADIESLQKQISQLQGQVKDLKSQVGDLETAGEEQQSQIDTLENAVGELIDELQM
jgi:peptidoglycan hydrolase CwlO-like protein